MRRRAGVLLPLEIGILRVVAARGTSEPWLHGFAIAKELRDTTAATRLTAHGTLYKALARLADGGLLESRWEEAEVALAEERPRRHLYRITGAGLRSLANAVEVNGAADRMRRIAPA